MLKRVPVRVVPLLLLAAACAPQPATYLPSLDEYGAVRLYLQPLPLEAQRVVFTIAAVFAIRHDDLSIPLPPSFTEVKGKDLAGAQKHLVSGVLPPGSYRGISIEIGEAFLVGDDGPTDLLVPDEPLFVEREFDIDRRRTSALFLSLDREGMVRARTRFEPVFSLATPRRQLENLLGFATNSKTNVVSVFNKFTMQVVDTIATGSGPKGIAIDRRRGWVYVAVAGDDAIEAIDSTTGEILRRLQMNFGDEPVEIALSPDGETLVSANRGSNTASVIDANSLSEIGRIRLPSEPTSVAMSPIEPRAYVVQPLSNAISIVDVPRREFGTTRTLDEIPVRAAVGRNGDLLYVITRHSSDLLVLDARTLAITARIFAGPGAASIEVDAKTGLVYVGKKRGEIAVIDPALSMPIDVFRVRGDVAYLDIDDEENSLFVLLSDRRTIQKMDLVSKRVMGVIEVEEEGYAVALMGRR